MWLDDSDEEMEMMMAHVMGLAERYAGPAQPAAACSTGENNGSTAQQTQQTGEPQMSQFHWLVGFSQPRMSACLLL